MRDITIDSGASETVCNDSDFGKLPTNPGIGSRNGVKYMSASGNHLANLGEKSVAFATEDWQARNMKFQVCDVTKPLASVSHICKKGHRVVFENGFGCIENLTTGELTWLREERGQYILDVWIPAQGFPRQGQ